MNTVVEPKIFRQMTEQEYTISQEIIAIILKYGAIGFVGTFAMPDPDGFTTFTVVKPGYDRTKFKVLEGELTVSLEQIFGFRESSRSESHVTPLFKPNEMPH